MSYVENCKKHGQYHNDYCGECIEDTERELRLTKDMLDSADQYNQELTKENSDLKETVKRLALEHLQSEGQSMEQITQLETENARLQKVVNAARGILENYSENFWRDPEWVLKEAIDELDKN